MNRIGMVSYDMNENCPLQKTLMLHFLKGVRGHYLTLTLTIGELSLDMTEAFIKYQVSMIACPKWKNRK